MSGKDNEGIEKAKEGAEAAKDKAQGGKTKPRKEKSKPRKDKSKQQKGVVGYCRMVVQHVLGAYWFAKASCHEDPGTSLGGAKPLVPRPLDEGTGAPLDARPRPLKKP